MQSEKQGGGAAARESSPSYFSCDCCGVIARSTEIQYTDLGYPRCPDCGTRYGPRDG